MKKQEARVTEWRLPGDPGYGILRGTHHPHFTVCIPIVWNNLGRLVGPTIPLWLTHLHIPPTPHHTPYNTPPPHPQHTPYNSNHTTCHILHYIVNNRQTSHRQHGHKIPILVTKYIYSTHSVCPPWSELGPSPPPPSPASECVSPPPEPKEWGTHSPAGEGVGESLFGRLEWRTSLALCLLCDTKVISMNPSKIEIFPMKIGRLEFQ